MLNSNEKQLQEELKAYSELAKKDKGIDVASLMMQALEKRTVETDEIALNQKRLGYVVSIGAPPFGLLFAFKFYFSGKSDGKHAAIICVVLTIIAIISVAVIFRTLPSRSGLNAGQLQQINSQDIQQLLE
jgi:hypothetical protein